jgi:hypothetical protein
VLRFVPRLEAEVDDSRSTAISAGLSVSNQQDYEYHLYLRSGLLEATRSFDKTILTLAGGALALSVTFIGEVVGKDPSSTNWLIAGWGSLVASLVINAVSYLTAERSFYNALHKRDQNALRWNRLTVMLNALSGGGLGLGLLWLALFAFRNIN